MLVLKIIGSVFGLAFAGVFGLFVYFFIQAENELTNCRLLTTSEYQQAGGDMMNNQPLRRGFQCSDGIHFQPHK